MSMVLFGTFTSLIIIFYWFILVFSYSLILLVNSYHLKAFFSGKGQTRSNLFGCTAIKIFGASVAVSPSVPSLVPLTTVLGSTSKNVLNALCLKMD